MKICFNCQKHLPDRGNFCPQCGIQVRCKECHDVLEPNARACVMCGTLVVERTNGIPATSIDDGNQPLNTLKIVEVANKDGRSREVHIQATNEAVGGMRVLWDDYHKRQPISDGDGASGYDGFEHTEIKKIGQSSTDPPAEDDIADLPKETEQDKEEVQETSAAQSLTSEQKSNPELIKQVFNYEYDQFRLKEPRLKAENKKDYAKRLSCLLVLAYEVEGKGAVTRKALNEMLKKHKVLDPNSIGWISKCSELEKDGESIRLNNPGYDLASKALKEIFDPNVKTNWMPSSQTSAGNEPKGGHSDRSDKSQRAGRKTSGRPSTINKWVSEWESRFQNIDGHNVLAGKSHLDKCLMALWAIRKVGGSEGKIVSAHLLSLFIKEAFEIQIHNRSLIRALTSDSAKDKVIKESPTKFQINPTGMAYVEQLLKEHSK
jgi:RNA polymerase subunit RPABC4/transcription elongation factor Spt4